MTIRMGKKLNNSVSLFMFLFISVTLYAQKDVAQFLGIPVDGFKPEMIQKLKSKGFTSNPYKKDVLVGEFNGTNVNIFILTNNNKVYRVAVVDANSTSEENIKIRFNNLIQQFQNNKNYSTLPDTILSKYIIPEHEDISYEISVNHKRYDAVFYQKSAIVDSLTKEQEYLISKDTLNDKENERAKELLVEIFKESWVLHKQVWFMITEDYGKYSITIFYENGYNKANGEDL